MYIDAPKLVTPRNFDKAILYIVMRNIFTILILSAALVEDTIFCMHGGLSPDLTDLKQVNNVPHFCVKL